MKMRFKKNKKAMFFTIDALIASLVLVAVIIMASRIYTEKPSIRDLQYYSHDSLDVLSELRVSELDDPLVQQLIENNSITRTNASVLEQIGIFWAEDNDEMARYLMESVISDLIPDQYNNAFLADSDYIISRYYTHQSDARQLTGYKQFISGIERDKPVEGHSATIYLSGSAGRMTSSFVYFQGFEGQGNITKRLFLPENFEIHDSYLELQTLGDFDLFVNDNLIGSFSYGSGGGTLAKPDAWTLSIDEAYLNSGSNDIQLDFTSNLNTSYIGGGFLRLTYLTTDYADPEIEYIGEDVIKKYWLPGIDGVINLYSAFDVPGTLNSMDIFLHFETNSTTFMNIQNTTIIDEDFDGETTIELDDNSLDQLFDYSELSNKTIVYRISSFNGTRKIFSSSGADVVLITDLSGSMKYRMNSWNNPGNAIPNCKPSDLTNPKSRRLGVAGCIDSQFNDVIMNESVQGNKNRLWLVDFSDDANPYFPQDLDDMTQDNIDLEIFDRYKSKSQHEIKGGTCICCAVNQAYEILNTYSNSSRVKAVLVMTDGVPTYCCGSYYYFGRKCDEEGTSTESEYRPSNCYGDQDDCSGNDCIGPENSAVNAAERLHEDLGATVYAVGFGPLDDCDRANSTLSRIAEKGNGSFLLSSNATILADFYRSVAEEIISKVSQQGQLITSVDNLSVSRLFDDSYIEISYTPITPYSEYGKIPITVYTDIFGNNISEKSVFFDSDHPVIDLKAISYSSNLWTSRISVDSGSGFVDVFSLDEISDNFTDIGDPFSVMVPINSLTLGVSNTVRVELGSSPSNISGGSPDNRLIYSILIPSSVDSGGVFGKAEGCTWYVEFEDGSSQFITIPDDYDGSEICYYANATYDPDDAVDTSAYLLMQNLDFDDDGLLDLKFDENNLVVEPQTKSEIPYMWGPTFIESRVWK